MKILVTGGLGYVGSALVPQLQDRGDLVSIVDPDWFETARVGSPVEGLVVAPDFRELDAGVVGNVEAVIHLAALSNDPLGALNPAITHHFNNRATVDLAQRAKQAGVKVFVFASSCSVYGDSGATEINEDSPTNPLTAYSMAKLKAEQEILSLANADFRVAILRGATAFGWAACPRTDLLLNEFCAETACGRPIELMSDGTSWRPFMPVSDFARALEAAVHTPPQDNGFLPIWNIAPPTMQMTVADAVRRAAQATNAPSPVFADGSGKDLRSYRVDGSRFLAAYPTFDYSLDFEGEIEKAVSGFSRIATLKADLANKRFIRLANLDLDYLEKTFPSEACGENHAI